MKITKGLICLAGAACVLGLVASCDDRQDSGSPDAQTALDSSHPWLDGGQTMPDASPPPPPGAIQIQLLTTRGDPVEDALVKVDGIPFGNTDADGLYCAQDVDDGGVTVRLSSASCSTVERLVWVMSNEITTLKLACLPLATTILADAVSGGVIIGPGGFELVIPPASLSTSGDPVIGSVEVHYGILNRPEDMAAAPGNMLAQAGGGTPFELESFGMAEIIFTKNGTPVQFEGEATLTIPLSNLASYVHGETLPLWSFNQDMGTWEQEGVGVVDTQTTGAPLFVTTVTHFSWWNADIPMERSCVEGRLLDANGDPAVGVTVSLSGVDYLFSTTTKTDANGHFCMAAKRGSFNHLWAGYADGYQAYTWDATGLEAGSGAGSCGSSACADLGDLSMIPAPDFAVCP